MMPHKIYEEEKFFEEAKALKARFEVGHEKTLFPSTEFKSIPMDGLPIYTEQTWEKIRT